MEKPLKIAPEINSTDLGGIVWELMDTLKTPDGERTLREIDTHKLHKAIVSAIRKAEHLLMAIPVEMWQMMKERPFTQKQLDSLPGAEARMQASHLQAITQSASQTSSRKHIRL